MKFYYSLYPMEMTQPLRGWPTGQVLIPQRSREARQRWAGGHNRFAVGHYGSAARARPVRVLLFLNSAEIQW
jgi:hypothetical protein